MEKASGHDITTKILTEPHGNIIYHHDSKAKQKPQIIKKA